MKKINKLGFTLIELLVVITIIGILATGAVSVYSSQIQKARDSTRITDMNALRGAVEQAFADMSQYPNNKNYSKTNAVCDFNQSNFDTKSSIACVVKLGFLDKLPTDPKKGQSGSGTVLNYTYHGADKDGVTLQSYELSTGVEAKGMRTSRANGDGGDDNLRVEFGVIGAGIATKIKYTNTSKVIKECNAYTNTENSSANGSDNDVVVISGGDCSG